MVSGKVLDMSEVEVNGELISFDAFVNLDKSTILTFDARGCTSLVSLDLPTATYVDARGCSFLVSLNLPAATLVSFDGCTSLSPDELSKVVQSMRDGEFKTACPAPVVSAALTSAP